jgi:DNA-directed RNA polymerase specialized sigma subunit
VQVVELHYFGGMTFEEVAGLLGIGRSTVIRDLKLAQMWLKDFVAA